MVKLRLVERIDGDWCAYIEGHEDDAVAGPTGDEALGRLVRERPDRFGVDAIEVNTLDPGLGGEPAARSRFGNRLTGPDADAPEIHGDLEGLTAE